ncbi:FkbM family methyltransferase [Paenibacillus sp.]|uniref:FkbM family methyltransferase n=1 Tax=Paenibacillus sp. TaxID=58172 RepID=UPI0028B10BCE|nr:FkbM family methyltransferase [Paenibacillus sp.]
MNNTNVMYSLINRNSKFISTITTKYENIICVGCSIEWFTNFYPYKTNVESYNISDDHDGLFEKFDFIYIYSNSSLLELKRKIECSNTTPDIALSCSYVEINKLEELKPRLKLVSDESVFLNVGTLIQYNNKSVVYTKRGDSGFSLFGPYASLQKGEYFAKFELEFYEDIFPFCIDNKNEVAVLSIAVNDNVIAMKQISLNEMLFSNIFSLEFNLLETSQVEMRVYSTGNYSFIANVNRYFQKASKINNHHSNALPEQLLENENENYSYSQAGEDVIAKWLLMDCLKLDEIRYLDIGAHHPSSCNNTYLFYKFFNCKGVCVEADPSLVSKIAEKRTRDIVLNVGITQEESNLLFYVMDEKGLNTFSESIANKYVNELGRKIEKVIEVPTMNINQVLSEYFLDGIDFVSIDTEGLEMEILTSIDFDKYRPISFCIETIQNGRDGFYKEKEIIEFLELHGYRVFADTFINTIFVDDKYKF